MGATKFTFILRIINFSRISKSIYNRHSNIAQLCPYHTIPENGIMGHSHIYRVWGNPSLRLLDIILQNVQKSKTCIYAKDSNTTVMWSGGRLEKYLQQKEKPEKNVHQIGCILLVWTPHKHKHTCLLISKNNKGMYQYKHFRVVEI
jgi:hypothetical protein